MKLVVAIVQDYDCDRLLSAISDAGLRATRVASTGGFLRMGNTTVLMGVEATQVSQVVDVLRTCCGSRVDQSSSDVVNELGLLSPGGVSTVPIGGAVVFVTNVDRFIRIPISNS